MTTLFLHSPEIFRYRFSGWVISLVAHGLVIIIATFFMTTLRLTKQPDPFRWEVRLTQPPAPQTTEAPSQPPSPVPPKKVPESRKLAQKPPTPTEQSLIHTRQVSQAVQSTPVAQQEIRKLERVVQPEQVVTEISQSQPTVSRQLESLHTTVDEQFVVTNAAPTAQSQPIIDQSQSVTEAAPAVARTVVEKTGEATTEQILSAEKAVTEVTAQTKEMISAPVETAAVQTRPSVEATSKPAIEASPVEPSTVASRPIMERPVNPSDSSSSVQQTSISNVPAQSAPVSKTDYSWLVDALWSRVEQFKRYPYIARTNRWEGLVVLKVVLNQDGQLLDLKVAESSGHLVLDQDAMEVMRKSCPLHLKHPLGKSQVVVHVPISYKLR